VAYKFWERGKKCLEVHGENVEWIPS
jgi:hypothetical protein